jgi:glycerol-3-phosphate acyltransferase PlsY
VTALLLLLGYGCGAIPTGVLLTRRVGVDVRTTGSGNIGATNVARTAGMRLGVATLAGDVLKGMLPVIVARLATSDAGLWAAVGLAAVVGHVFPVTLRFAGGKGVATALGVVLALCPAAAGVAVAVFAAVVAAWRWVSVASMVAALAAPVAMALAGCPPPVVGAGLAMAALVVLRHRENLSRLIAGTEPTIQLLKRQASPKQ